MSGDLTTDRRQLRDEIMEQVKQEMALAWQDELEHDAKLRKPRLDHTIETPEPFATWLNMAPEPEQPLPGLTEVLAFEQRNELGDAEMFQALHEGKHVFDHAAKKWMDYDGVVWRPDSVANAKRLAMTSIPEVYENALRELKGQLEDEQAKADTKLGKLRNELADAEQQENKDLSGMLKDRMRQAEKEFAAVSGTLGKKREALVKRVKSLRGNNRAVSVLEVARAGKGSLGVSGDEWETHPTLFAVANGVVDLETGKLFPSRPDLYLQNASPFPYLGLYAHSAWWDDHLRKVFCGDERLISYFEWAVGCSVTGYRFNKDIWVAYGPQANNGKSATFNTIKDVMGGYATTIKVDLLLDDGMASRGPDPDLMVIDGLRLGIASEAGKKAKFSIERIKGITGGDDVRARGLFADSKIIKSMVKLWLHTNSIPKMSGYDPGFMLRLKVVPFMARFTERPQEVDPEKHVYQAMDESAFRQVQKKEFPYVLSWILRCARKFFRNPRYELPEVVKRFTTDYFDDQDTIGQFINACCVLTDDAKTQAKDLYNAFRKYCSEELSYKEDHIMSQRSFGTDLKNRFKRHESNVAYYLGIALKPEWEAQGKLEGTG